MNTVDLGLAPLYHADVWVCTGMQARKDLVDWLNSHLREAAEAEDYRPLAVVGMGGLGKSTLANAVCHDRRNAAGTHTCLLELPSASLEQPEVRRLLRQAMHDLCSYTPAELDAMGVIQVRGSAFSCPKHLCLLAKTPALQVQNAHLRLHRCRPKIMTADPKQHGPTGLNIMACICPAELAASDTGCKA